MSSIKKFTLRLLVIIALLVVVAFTARSGQAEIVDKVVAVVNDSIITLSELNAASVVAGDEGLKGSKGVSGVSDRRSRILDSLIEQKLVKQAADRAGIEVSELEIDSAVEDVKKQNKFTQEGFLIALARSGLTTKEYRDQLKEQIREVKFVNRRFRSKVMIEKSDIEEYYTQHIEKYHSPSSMRIRIMVISSRNSKERNKRLKAVEKRLKAGEAFSIIAKEVTDGPAASKGGDLGFVFSSEVEQGIVRAAQALKPGDISEPFLTRGGITMIQLVERREGEPLPLKEVRETIRTTLFNKYLDEDFNYWLQDVRKIAHVEVRL